MNHYHKRAEALKSTVVDDICYISPKGHYYVAKGNADGRFVRDSHLITRYQAAFAKGKLTAETLARLESLAKRLRN
jgi:hypothetical protein